MNHDLCQTPGLRLERLHMLLLSSRGQYSLSRLAQIFKCSRQTGLARAVARHGDAARKGRGPRRV